LFYFYVKMVLLKKLVKYMRKTLLYLFLFTLFIPLLISGQFFFPYVFFKGIIFRLIVIFASLFLEKSAL